MRQSVVSVLLVYASLVAIASCWRIFHRGRHVGGNLGEPHVSSLLKDQLLPGDEWFTQILDHFDTSDDRTWKQRFFTNDEFYVGNRNGPVFLMIGGEGEASAKWMKQGSWIDYAQQYGALCFQLEHRYYGKSRPTKDMSTKNLQYLTSQQALADIATFITTMNTRFNMSSEVQWIAFGGSYPGSLAAWLRAKYPHLVHGAMSASGPLLAQLDFYDYFRVVDESLTTYSEECLAAVQKGTAQIAVLARHMVGQRSLNEKFRLCDPLDKSINNVKDVSNLYETLAGNFANVVQYNKDNRVGKDVKGANITIDTLCDIMTDNDIQFEMDRLAAINNLTLDTYDQKCLDYKYDKMIQINRNDSWDSTTAEGGRQWTYQTCTEFGFYQSSSYTPQVFGTEFPVEFFVDQCVDIFGPKFDSKFQQNAIERTNTLYGALDLEVSNVVFVHGSIDPWHALGITKTRSNNAPAIYIEGTAHCANMYPPSENDLPALKAARVEIAQLIGTWLHL